MITTGMIQSRSFLFTFQTQRLALQMARSSMLKEKMLAKVSAASCRDHQRLLSRHILRLMQRNGSRSSELLPALALLLQQVASQHHPSALYPRSVSCPSLQPIPKALPLHKNLLRSILKALQVRKQSQAQRRLHRRLLLLITPLQQRVE